MPSGLAKRAPQGRTDAAKQKKRAPKRGPQMARGGIQNAYSIRRRLAEIPSRQGLGGWVKLPVEDVLDQPTLT